MTASLPQGLQDAILLSLEHHIGTSTRILEATPLGGGSIHRVLRLLTNQGPFCIKYNLAHTSAMFEAEMEGLEALRQAAVLQVPAPIATGTSDSHAFLLLQWLPPAPKAPDFWSRFAQGLAALHRHSSPLFGWSKDNFIGSLPQRNQRFTAWIDLFALRLHDQAQRARLQGHWDLSLDRQLQAFIARLPERIPLEPPALLHGDLWSGNFLTTTGGLPAIIDPAIHYGHREAELAFSRLFGGFDTRFYESYSEAYPLHSGWQERISAFNLYPLMVHLNLFGRSYLPDIQAILSVRA